MRGTALAMKAVLRGAHALELMLELEAFAETLLHDQRQVGADAIAG